MTEEKCCPACGCETSTLAYSARGSDDDTTCYGSRRLGKRNPHGTIHTCDRCGWGFTYPMPEESELERRYRSLSEPCYLTESHVRLSQFRNELQSIQRMRRGRPASLLDIGCSYGLMLQAAREVGMSAVGLELAREQVAYCRSKGFDIRQGGITELGSEEKFDIIIMWDVLEHLIDPAESLIALRKHAHMGAVISLVVPNRNSHIARLLRERWWSIIDLHLHYPTESGMERLLKRVGFTPVHVGTHPKVVTVRQLARWIPLAAVRLLAERLVSPQRTLRLDPRDQMLIRAIPEHESVDTTEQ